jgi:hypothetical protein
MGRVYRRAGAGEVSAKPGTTAGGILHRTERDREVCASGRPAASAPKVHFDLFTGASIEGMLTFECLFHATQAAAAHRVLQAIARDTGRYPSGREMRTTAGVKMKATRSKAIVVVYCVPVNF